MMSGRILTTTSMLTILIIATLLAATLATPTLAATNQLTASKIPTPGEIMQGKMVTDYLSMKFADFEGGTPINFTKWTITPRNLGFAFNIHPAHIIEFNDTNNNEVLDSNDQVLRDISLSRDVNWTFGSVSVTNDNASVSFVGTYNDNESKLILQLTVYIYVYFKDTPVANPENATGPGYSAVVPGLRAVKVDIVINHYEWVDGSGASKLALVMVLKCQQFEAEYEYRYRLANGTTFSDNDRMSGFVPPVSGDEDESEVGLVMARNEHEVRARFRWFNYALCSDTEQRVINVTSYFNVTEDGIELQLCVDHFGNSTVSFDPYFEVLSTEEGLPSEMILILLGYYYAVQSGQVVGTALAGAAVVLVAGVAVAVYFVRRR